MMIVWFCVNLRSGGMTTNPGAPGLRRHGDTSLDWLRDFPDIVQRSPLGRPDVILLQEAMYFDRHGDELLLFVERQLHRAGYGRYRGFLTRSNRSAHHQAVFLNTARLHAVRHWRGADIDESRDLRGFVETIVDGDETRTLWLKSVHLDPRDGDARLAEAKQIHAAVPMGQPALIAGDFNSTTSRRGTEPQPDYSAISVQRRYHLGTWPATKGTGSTTADTRAVDFFLDTGWTCQLIADRNLTPTVTSGHTSGGGLIIDRCLTTTGLTTVPGSVWVDTSTLPYSDHRALGGAVVIGGSRDGSGSQR